MNANEALAVIIALQSTGAGYLTGVTYAGGKWAVIYAPNTASAEVTLTNVAALPFAPRALARGLLAEWGLS